MGLRFPEPADEAYGFPLTIGHLLNAARGPAAEQKITYRDETTITYRTLVDRIGRLASMLTDLGVAEGVTVAVMDWDSHRYLEAFFAVPMMGAVLQNVNVRLPADQVAYTLRDAQAQVVIVHRDFLPLLDQVRAAAPSIAAVVVVADGVEDVRLDGSAGEYETLLAAAAPDYPFADFDENAVATTFYTSGTTGDPKGVSFTHRQLVLHTLAMAAALGSGPPDQRLGWGDVYMPLTPMFHVHAWGIPYVATMLGLRQVYPGRYEADLICRLRQAHGVTFSHGVPTILQMVCQAADATGADLAGWKMLIGGSQLTKALFREGSRRGMRLVAGYGMSETCPAISLGRPKTSLAQDERDEDALTAAGVTIPLVQARIVDEAMRPQPHDGQTRGELVLRAPWLTLSYAGAPEASDTLWRGGWMHTQDVASIDPAGKIQIRDRLKDVIKSGGEWIDSQHLEDLLAGVAGVGEVAVIAVPDAKWGERPLAVVVPAGDAPTLEALNKPVLAAIASGAITRYARLERFESLAALPRTSVGKIDKKRLRETLS